MLETVYKNMKKIYINKCDVAKAKRKGFYYVTTKLL